MTSYSTVVPADLSVIWGNISQKEENPRILAMSYMMYKIGKLPFLIWIYFELSRSKYMMLINVSHCSREWTVFVISISIKLEHWTQTSSKL